MEFQRATIDELVEMLDEEPDFPGTDYEDKEKIIKMVDKLGSLKVKQI